MVDMGAGHCV